MFFCSNWSVAEAPGCLDFEDQQSSETSWVFRVDRFESEVCMKISVPTLCHPCKTSEKTKYVKNKEYIYPESQRLFIKWSLDDPKRNFLYLGGAENSLWTSRAYIYAVYMS